MVKLKVKVMKLNQNCTRWAQSLLDWKSSFSNSKGMFVLRSMLKAVADQCNNGSTGTFQKLKLYYNLAINDKDI